MLVFERGILTFEEGALVLEGVLVVLFSRMWNIRWWGLFEGLFYVLDFPLFSFSILSYPF